jgi:hypothetical protein
MHIEPFVWPFSISNYTTLECFPAFSIVHFDIKPQNIIKQIISFLLQTFCDNEERPSKTGSRAEEVPPMLEDGIMGAGVLLDRPGSRVSRTR